ncbi:MAG: HAMP domain-containing histidine kinase [Holophagaceae bacterium]|nr:HAMP domain-containing histidine kinase [Holophagaceae bacterium]
MKGLLRPWVLYALALLLGLGAMGWITRTAMRTERAEQVARQKATQTEKVRLALWRMDSTMALFLSPEAARPWSDYRAFHPADRAFSRTGRTGGGGELLIPSPFLVSDDALVLLRFQMDGPGRVTAPLVPGPEYRELASGIAGMAERRRLAEGRLREIQGRLTWDSVRAAVLRHGGVLFTAQQMQELQDRTRQRSPGSPASLRIASPFQVFQLAWTPFWEGDMLLLVRQVWVGGREMLQGCWLDWNALQEVLMSTIRDFFPGAALRPAQAGEGADAPGRLSSLPVRLVPGGPAVAPGLSAASKAALLAGWTFALLGALAGALVLARATVLSERRGAFASAVAHELRTPLTTFKLYTELLAHGMVTGEAEQRELHQTLLMEADRLDHLVKNVLAYARLESNRGVNLADILAGELLDRLETRLAERARQGGLVLERVEPPELRALVLHTDALVVEQILYNLVDNACKYAGGAGDRRVRLELALEDGSLVLRVRDQGPGIPAHERKRLFRPFQKLGPKEARAAPGVGLGLALCKRLARMLGGDLDYEPAAGGACFALRLPVRT